MENTRLTVLYWFLAIHVMFAVTFTFVTSEGYYTEKVPDGNVQFWAQRWQLTEDRTKELNRADNQKDHCVTSEKYEFCDDPDCSWSAKDMQCIDLCTQDSGEDCMEPSERAFKLEGSLFFPTYFTETSTRKVVDDKINERSVTIKKRIIKGVEDMGIGFQHEYEIRTPANEREEGSSRLPENGLLTILRDLDGNELDKWGPGERVSLGLKKIMEAGHLSLDTVQTDIGRNFLEGAKIPEGILPRLAGVEIVLELSYHNPSSYAHPGAQHSGPVCYITVHSKYWASQTQLQIVDHVGSSRFRYYQGVRIRFKSTGAFSWVHMDNILNKLSQLLVFFGATKQLVFFFSITFLGVVSKVYRGFVYQKVSLGKETCGMAARLTSHTSTFVELKDHPHGISEERLLRRFKRILEHNKEIDEAEIRRLVNFVFVRMAKHDRQGIDVQDFAQACTHGEALHFKTLVELFDADRKKGFLERTFAGPTMRALFSSDQAIFGADARQGDSSEDQEFKQVDPSSTKKSLVFEPGYVAAPIQVAACDLKGNTKEESNEAVEISEIEILPSGDQMIPQDIALASNVREEQEGYRESYVASFPFCSSRISNQNIHFDESMARDSQFVHQPSNNKLPPEAMEGSILDPLCDSEKFFGCSAGCLEESKVTGSSFDGPRPHDQPEISGV